MFRQWRFQSAVKREARRRYRRGEITRTQLKKAQSLTYEQAGVVLRVTQVKSGEYPILEAIWAFVVEHWDEILKAVLLIVPMLLDERDD